MLSFLWGRERAGATAMELTILALQFNKNAFHKLLQREKNSIRGVGSIF